MARRNPSRGGARRGKTFLDPVIEQLAKDAKAYTDRQMKALIDMERARNEVQSWIRPSDRNR